MVDWLDYEYNEIQNNKIKEENDGKIVLIHRLLESSEVLFDDKIGIFCKNMLCFERKIQSYECIFSHELDTDFSFDWVKLGKNKIFTRDQNFAEFSVKNEKFIANFEIGVFNITKNCLPEIIHFLTKIPIPGDYNENL